jgi:hypothetical protein
MTRFHRLCGGLAIAMLAVPGAARAEEIATAAVRVEAQFFARTSLQVSNDLLQFDVVPSGDRATATASVSFLARARTASGADIVLTVEPLRSVEGPGGAADGGTALSFAGDGHGLLSGELSTAVPALVGRWQGSGVREGRVVFTLRADAMGNYRVPVRFVLSAP